MCGVFAVSQSESAARITFLGLFALQHRGQESAGITTVNEDGLLLTQKESGLVAEVFKPEVLDKLAGHAALGHVRYSTAGGGIEANVQPLTARIAGCPVAIAHNGNIVNAQAIRNDLEDSGSILHGTADTEIVLHLLARSRKPTFTERFLETVKRLEGGLHRTTLNGHPSLWLR